ncbi:hypothetical protein GQ53DRAFT_128986 [Thozetella sp. PMI_491]|nr:hypothetical protein GQ53DRAFT_128986 [Thozetella sp. PMI_491]
MAVDASFCAEKAVDRVLAGGTISGSAAEYGISRYMLRRRILGHPTRKDANERRQLLSVGQEAFLAQ